MMEKRKHYHCPVKDHVTFTYQPFLALSRSCRVLIPVSRGTAPHILRRPLTEHVEAGELSKALLTEIYGNMSHVVASLHEVCRNVFTCHSRQNDDFMKFTL